MNIIKAYDESSGTWKKVGVINSHNDGKLNIAVNTDYAYGLYGVEDFETIEAKLNEIGEKINEGKAFVDLSWLFYGLGRSIGMISDVDFSVLKNGVINLNHMFYNCTGLSEVDIRNLNTSNVIDMSYMFAGLSNCYNIILGARFNTSKCTNMSYMFHNVKVSSLDLSNFDTSKVIDMSYMFGRGMSGSRLTSLDLSNFDTSNVRTMLFMFNYQDNLTSLNVSSFDTSKVRTMNGMFDGCRSLPSLDLSNFNTSNCTDMANMFYDCSALTSLDLSSFDTSKVESIQNMFKNCSSLESIDLGHFDMSSCADLNYLLQNCNSLRSVVLPDFTNLYQNPWGPIISSTSDDLTITWGGEYKTFGRENSSASLVFDFSQVWMGATSNFIANYETFANSIGQKKGNYSRTIKINTNLYNALSDDQKALITNKGYNLTYGT